MEEILPLKQLRSRGRYESKPEGLREVVESIYSVLLLMNGRYELSPVQVKTPDRQSPFQSSDI